MDKDFLKFMSFVAFMEAKGRQKAEETSETALLGEIKRRFVRHCDKFRPSNLVREIGRTFVFGRRRFRNPKLSAKKACTEYRQFALVITISRIRSIASARRS